VRKTEKKGGGFWERTNGKEKVRESIKKDRGVRTGGTNVRGRQERCPQKLGRAWGKEAVRKKGHFCKKRSKFYKKRKFLGGGIVGGEAQGRRWKVNWKKRLLVWAGKW